MHKVICQEWEESERNFGVRPDGYSLHKDKEDLASFIKHYWDSMPDNTPDEYSRPGNETSYECEVGDETWRVINSLPYGARFFGKTPRKVKICV